MNPVCPHPVKRSNNDHRSWGQSNWRGGCRTTDCLLAITICLSCVLAVLPGCSRKEVAKDNRASNSSPAVRSDPAAPSIKSIVVEGDTKETARLWSDSVKRQLAQVAKSIAKDGVAEKESQAAMAGHIEMIDPERMGTTQVYQGRSIQVTEISLRPPLSTSGLAGDTLINVEKGEFLGKLRELLGLHPNAADDSVYFKLFGITSDGERLKTRQRLTARGTRDGKPVRSYAVVDATWARPKKASDKPQLVGFTMPLVVRSELIAVGSDGQPAGMFEDITSQVLAGNPAWSQQLQLGMNTWVRHIDRSLNPDFLGYHGIAIGDVDGDGLEDVYLCQPGGLPNLLFRQEADGSLADVSDAAGVDWLDNSTGALLVDLDNDGDKDLAVATHTAFLVMENNGAAEFTLRARLADVAVGYSPTAADYDLDGDLDLLVLRYTATDSRTGDFPTPHPFHDARNGGANVLLQNQGDFRFADVTNASGLGVDNHRFSFAASWEDYDNDGDLDLYIANDFGPNQLFRNAGHSFTDESRPSGTEDWGFGMSATWADFDRDGNMDLYVSSMFSGAGNQIVAKTDFNPSMPNETRQKYLKMVRGNTLLRNGGQGRFSDVTNPMAEGFGGWAWGSKFADLNNDGWEDLYVANGYISQPDKDDL